MRKTALLFFFTIGLLSAARSQSIQDSTEYLTIKDNYNAHAAFVNGNQWTTSLGNQRLGRRWQNVAAEFELSPQGKAAFLLALQQKGKAPTYVLGGYALMIGSLPLLASATISNNNNLEGGIGAGMAIGGLALVFVGSKKVTAATDNFQKALWLRNRDALLQFVPPTDQPHFKYIYEQETIYLTKNGYIKNGHKQELGFLGGKAAKEFRSVPGASEQFKKYRNNQRLGALLYVAGLTTMVASITSHNGLRGPGLGLYIGGAVVAGAGGGILSSSRRFLSQAVYLRNYTVLERQMLRR